MLYAGCELNSMIRSFILWIQIKNVHDLIEQKKRRCMLVILKFDEFLEFE